MKKLIVLFISSILLFLAANLSVVRAQEASPTPTPLPSPSPLPTPPPYIIRDDETGGHCQAIGTWVGGETKTCTLTQNVGGGIEIADDRITLEGNGNTLTGPSSSGNGVTIDNKTAVTVKNLIVRYFDYGIGVIDSSDINLNSISFSNNQQGIFLLSSTNSHLENNTFSKNSSAGIYLHSSNNNFIRNNIVSNDKNEVTDTIYGISLYSSNDNIITENTFSNGDYGIYLDYNYYPFPSGNWIYNNNFIDNTIQAEGSAGGNFFNKDKPIGGNYWSDWTGHPDADHDGFIEDSYGFSGGVDIFPRACPIGTTPTPDTTPPVTTATFSGTPGTNGWYKSNVLVTLSATDTGGACGGGGTVASTQYGFDGVIWNNYTAPVTVSNEGTTTLYYRSTDGANNVESTKTQVLKIDKTVPQIVINKPQDGKMYILKQNVLADWSVSDAISGIASSSGTVASGQPIDTASVGVKNFTVNAADIAGNQVNQNLSYNVAYSYSGALWPIEEDGSSVFRLGWIIPVRFRLRDASGNYVASANAQLYLAKVENGVVGDEIEAVSALPRIYPGNEFRYSPWLREYNFYMATRSLSRGVWQLRIALDDGTSKTVNITLR